MTKVPPSGVHIRREQAKEIRDKRARASSRATAIEAVKNELNC